MNTRYKVLVKITQKQPAWNMIISAKDRREAERKAAQAGAIEIRECKLIKVNQ